MRQARRHPRLAASAFGEPVNIATTTVPQPAAHALDTQCQQALRVGAPILTVTHVQHTRSRQTTTTDPELAPAETLLAGSKNKRNASGNNGHYCCGLRANTGYCSDICLFRRRCPEFVPGHPQPLLHLTN